MTASTTSGKGAHIINGKSDRVDFRIGHTDDLGDYDMVLSDKGEIKIRTRGCA